MGVEGVEEGGGIYEGQLLVGGEGAVVLLVVRAGGVIRLGIELGGVSWGFGGEVNWVGAVRGPAVGEVLVGFSR